MKMLLIAFLCFLSCCLGQKPLVFRYFRDNPEKVRLIWNPTLNIANILQVAQREVIFEENQNTGKPESVFNPWRVLVTEDQEHGEKNRYVFVKDNPCTELDFQVSYRTRSGEIVKDVIQTLKSQPEKNPMGAVVKLKSLKKEDSKIVANIDWSIDLSVWEELKSGPVKPRMELLECKTLFTSVIPDPEISDDGKSIKFDPQYAYHQCSFEYRLGFPIWQNETSCQRDVVSKDDEAITIDLDCEKIDGLDCPKPSYACNMDCSPTEVKKLPVFEVLENATELFINLTWTFQKPAKTYAVRYYHSWLHFHNQAYENDNATVETVPTPSVILNPESVVPISMWVAQICALYEPCKEISWVNIPSRPIPYFEMHDIPPTWPTEEPTTQPPPTTVRVSTTEKAPNKKMDGNSEKKDDMKTPEVPKEKLVQKEQDLPKPKNGKNKNSISILFISSVSVFVIFW